MTHAATLDHELIAFFDDLAPRWDAMQSPERDARVAALLAPHAALFAGVRRVLDVGSGTGAFLPQIARLAPATQVIALDLSPVMLGRAQAAAAGRGIQVLGWLRGDGHVPPLAPASVDLITCHDSFAHLEDRLGALRMFRRVLRPGGHLLVLHDIPRERVNAIHGAAASPRVRAHQLPPIEAVIPLVQAAGLTVIAALDAPDHYLLSARRDA